MAVKVYTRILKTAAVSGNYESPRYYVCDTADDLPASGLLPGDKALILSPPSRKTCYNGTAWSDDAGQAGPHTHPMSDITGLALALAAKSDLDHNHDGVYSPAGHTHAWPGFVLNGAAANQATTTDGQTLYWGSIPNLAPTTTAGNTRIYVPRGGIIKAATVFAHAATAGTAEAWVMNIRVNNSTDWQIASLASAANQRLWANYALSVAVAEGAYVEIKEVCPTWATNPANVRRACSIYVE